MKKPTDKQIKSYLQDISSNFTPLIDAIIWYELHDMDDWATDIIDAIESLPSEQEIKLLFNDLASRADNDFSVYSYQRLWWAVINTDSDDIKKLIIDFCKNTTGGPLLIKHFKSWYEMLDSESETKPNIQDILTKF